MHGLRDGHQERQQKGQSILKEKRHLDNAEAQGWRSHTAGEAYGACASANRLQEAISARALICLRQSVAVRPQTDAILALVLRVHTRR